MLTAEGSPQGVSLVCERWACRKRIAQTWSANGVQRVTDLQPLTSLLVAGWHRARSLPPKLRSRLKVSRCIVAIVQYIAVYSIQQHSNSGWLFSKTPSTMHGGTDDGFIHQVQSYDAKGCELSLSHIALQEGDLGIGVEEEVGEEAGQSGLAKVGLSEEEDGGSWGGEEGVGILQFWPLPLPQASLHVLIQPTFM